MIREAVALDDELALLVDRCERELSDIVRRRGADADAARAAVRLQTELLEADLSDPATPASWHRDDAAATVERYEKALARLQSARQLVKALRALRAGDDRTAQLEQELEEQRAELERRRVLEADLRALIAVQREDLAESARIVEAALLGSAPQASPVAIASA